ATLRPLVAATNPSVLSLDLQRHPKPKSIDARHPKRSTISAALEQISGSYFVNVSFGTPPQQMRLLVDARTADTWLNSANSTLCTSSTNCATYGSYDPDSSSSYKFISGGFEIQYADGSSESGDYVTDNMTISGATMNNIQFAVATRTQSSFGNLGLAYAVQEVTVINNDTQPYPNVPQALANLGLINSNAYSIWLNDHQASAGTLLFGGVDTDKYTGELRTIPIVPRKSSTADVVVPLTELRFGDTVLLSGQNLTTGVDSATTLTYLPDNVTSLLYTLFDVQYHDSVGAGVIDCAHAKNETIMSFTLSWPVVNITMNELVIPFIDESGNKSCLFGIAPGGNGGSDSLIVLGETFLRSAYVVYDLANNELSIAQTLFNATTSNIIEITNDINGVPGA
ncbi:aspartic peptidase domain-containing protein, partial [Lophiotrema nucula]